MFSRAGPGCGYRRGVLGDGDVRGFLAGDADAVRAVYREYGRLVFAVAYKVLGDRDLAEEATQQTFLQAWRSAQSFDPTREMAPWLATIARRAAIDLHRREARRTHARLDEFDSQAAVVTLPDAAETAYEVWEVRRAIEALPPEERDVVRLQHLEGLTHTEIAERIGVPPGTVKSRSFRAHRHLAARLGHLREELA
jgi:RNA polymerase sigma factor (sigma-70 family)